VNSLSHLARLVLAFALCATAIALAGCPWLADDGCELHTTRCAPEGPPQAQTCGQGLHRRWVNGPTCPTHARDGRPVTCCFVREPHTGFVGFTCAPEDRCEAAPSVDGGAR
jgi:hypothetical protein